MTTRGSTDITCTRQGTTLIYVDTRSGSAGSAVKPAYDWVYWLAVPPADPPATMTLEEAWTPNRGYLLFIDETPPDWATLETELAAALDPSPVHTGFGWITTARVTGDLVATVSANETVAADVLIAAPSHLPWLDIKAGTPVTLDPTGPSGGDPAIALSHPPIPAHGNQPAAEPPSGPGVSIGFTGSDAGAARFQLLQAFPGAADPGAATAVVKHVFAATFDPVRPTRTRFSYTGADIVVAEIDGVFSIAAT